MAEELPPLFPHAQVREVQLDFLNAVQGAVRTKGNLIVHAPTGLGKTAAAPAPALAYALDHNKAVVFVTSRNTQHLIAMETLSAMRAKSSEPFHFVDVVGKKHLCLQPNVGRLQPREFIDYCRALRQDTRCEYYSNLRKGEALSGPTLSLLRDLKARTLTTTATVLDSSRVFSLCPYEVTMLLGKESAAIVTDYSYIFAPSIRESFFKRIDRTLDDCILIVDEAHNLPGRVKDLASSRLSLGLVKRARTEADKYGYGELVHQLLELADILDGYGKALPAERERYVSRDEFASAVARIQPYAAFQAALESAGAHILEEQQLSAVAAVAEFLDAWEGEDAGFTRIVSAERFRGEDRLILSYRCLDPSVVTSSVFRQCHSAVLMSGTLTPTAMYRELLGVDDVEECTFPSPFPPENRLALVIPKTSTKYTQRSEATYKEIGGLVSSALSAIPGNCAVFFPSYQLRDDIGKHITTEKPSFLEVPEMSREARETLLSRFRAYKATGAVLFATIAGSFGEGIDLPGDELRGVVIVGLPLARPDLETKAIISYYDKKLGNGWDFGYTLPAITKALQCAGRCIRSETDRGVIVFLDERYAYPSYAKAFPADWNLVTTLLFEKRIKEFFGTAQPDHSDDGFYTPTL